ncbi:40S ribosomal protein S24-2 [Zea mays]|uniref:40S ribosomal protein S24-2 n=1 Tax=Zea mays TaxID=4577 RepID=A0A3L6E7T6_MAIZE|nr:40S ribosomal protein S24-2 [Zea mays]
MSTNADVRDGAPGAAVDAAFARRALQAKALLGDTRHCSATDYSKPILDWLENSSDEVAETMAKNGRLLLKCPVVQSDVQAMKEKKGELRFILGNNKMILGFAEGFPTMLKDEIAMVLEVIHLDHANVSKMELKERLAKMYKVKDRNTIFVFKFRAGSTGSGLIYDNLDSKKFEPKYCLIWHKFAKWPERLKLMDLHPTKS